jgi:TRAP-type transport system small permease protein
MGIIERLERISNSFSKWLNWAAGIGLVAMLGLVIADVVAIKLFNSPIPGAIEIVAFLGVIVTAFAIAHTYVLGGHIRVEFLMMRLPARLKTGISSFVLVLSIILFVLLAWQSFKYGTVLHRTAEVSMTQKIPFYPFVYAIGFSCIPVCMLLLVEFIKTLLRVGQR